MTGERGYRRVVFGKVVSDKMDKTVVVQIARLTKHQQYGRLVKRITKVKAHDEKNECRVGDKVRLMETRPLSKQKQWRVMEIVERTAM
jgi:small subunit ribosomal protein S17